jgi:hypothetical protein
LDINYVDRSDSLDVTAIENAAHGLKGEERQAVQMLMFEAATDSTLRTVGDLLDRIDRASPAERRQMFNSARQKAGLPTAEAADARRKVQEHSRALRGLPMRDEAGYADPTICAAPACANFPVDPATGLRTKSRAKRWWCSAHADRAEPGDLEAWSLRIRYTESGALQFLDEVEADQLEIEREQERRRIQREAAAAERAEKAKEMREHEAAMDEYYRPKGAGWQP